MNKLHNCVLKERGINLSNSLELKRAQALVNYKRRINCIKPERCVVLHWVNCTLLCVCTLDVHSLVIKIFVFARTASLDSETTPTGAVAKSAAMHQHST